jgi:hypothetical protein
VYRAITFIIITAILVVDLTNSFLRGVCPVLSWHDLVLATLLLFIGAGEKISRLVLSPKSGLTIEQQVREFRDDLKRIELFGESSESADLENLLQKATRLPQEIWSRIIFYRLLLRAVLRKKCKSNGIPLKLTTSLTIMVNTLKSFGGIDLDLAIQLKRVIHATFAAEWGEGELPTEEELKYVLEEAPEIIKKVDRL